MHLALSSGALVSLEFSPPGSPMRWEMLLSLFYGYRNRDSERLSNFTEPGLELLHVSVTVSWGLRV